MKMYSVKEISEMLNTTPETVRRWIRGGKLEADQMSRKEGNVVSEEKLYSFLKSTGKYASVATAMAITNPILGLGGAISGILGSSVIKYFSQSNEQKKLNLDKYDIDVLIKKNIEISNESIEKKQKMIEQLQAEIEIEENKIKEYKFALENFLSEKRNSSMKNKKGEVKLDKLIFEIDSLSENLKFTSSIEDAINQANLEIEILNETINTVNQLNPKCDKLDYILSASSGALCGIIDIFLVGKPGESPLGNITDKWFENRTKDFAKLCGWNGGKSNSLSSAIRYLEKEFKVPYDQTGIGEVFKGNYITPRNHHFKSLAHNPSLLGLFFSMLDQFSNDSHFVGETAFSHGMSTLITLSNEDEKFQLMGKNVPSKLFCAIVNWLGHLMSDVSGSSSTEGRGMGIPSPLWTWTNDIVVIKSQLGISVSEFDKSVNELALKIFNKGYDIRFQTVQAIPVFINEMVVRLMYSVRRLIKYYSETEENTRNFKELWIQCEPFSNSTVKRMLTVAHGVFCLVDIGDASIRGCVTSAGFNTTEFFLRLNIIGIGRFAISLYGGTSREMKPMNLKARVDFVKRKKVIIDDYIEGLKILSDIYDDRNLVDFIHDLEESDMYKIAFEKSLRLAEMRSVPKEKVVKNKEDIDTYFGGAGNA